MRSAKWILLVMAGLLTAGNGKALATEYPFCMTTVEAFAGAIERCDFTTMQQCRGSTAGVNGSCAPNWRLAYRNEGANTIDRQQAKGKRLPR